MKKEVLQGMIISYGKCNEINENVFIIKNSTRTILRDDLSIKKDRKYYVGKIIDYVIEEVDKERNIFWGRIEYSKNTLKSIQDNLNNSMYGIIDKVLDWGAFISINGNQAKILNKDIFYDNTRIFEVFKDGDRIDNLRYKDNKYSLYVELIEKLSGPQRGIKKEDLVKGKEFEGTIRTIMPTACFVYILNERDVICSVPDQLEEEIERGSKVIVKLTTVSEIEDGNNKLRGKIVKIIEG